MARGGRPARKNLGLTGQPRFVVEHEKDGRTHRHVVWSRIDTERMRAIPDSLTAAIHERTSRELEIRLRPRARAEHPCPRSRISSGPSAGRRNTKSSAPTESGIDPGRRSRRTPERHWHSADNGHSFKAALEASGDYMLARGDRRDFVIIDRAGDDHSLARRLGVKAAEVRARMADLDPASLPSVNEAKAQQRERQAERDRRAEIDRAAEQADAGSDGRRPEAATTVCARPSATCAGTIPRTV